MVLTSVHVILKYSVNPVEKWYLKKTPLPLSTKRNAYVSPMELFRKALLRNAVMIVILHNHPSGDPTPSTEDKKLTEQIRAGASVLGLTLADHIVIGDQQYFSFRENKLL